MIRTLQSKTVRGALFCGAFLSLSVGAAWAGDWVYFKNGHKMLVESVREDGDLVYLKLKEGNEIGFPKALLDTVKATNERRTTGAAKLPHTGLGPGFDNLMGTQRAIANLGTAQRSRLLTSESIKSGERFSHGFSYMGSTDTSRMQRKTEAQSPWSARTNARQAGRGFEEANDLSNPLDGPPQGGGIVQLNVAPRVGDDKMRNKN